MPASTTARRQLVRRLVAAGGIRSQEQLLAELARRGVQATQPAISRDLRALHAAKQDGVYVLREEEAVTPLGQLQPLLRGAEAAGPHLVVVHCEPGAASAVARAFEAEAPSGVAGTVAGDDTVFVAVRSAAAGRRVLRTLRRWLGA